MIRLYDYALSGNCYKVRLLLRWLELEYETVCVDFYPGFEHRGEAFLEVNPLGQIPVIEDEGVTIRDAQAILVHLAGNYDKSGKWYPLKQPNLLGPIHSWLAFADGLTATCSAARLHDAMFMDVDIDKARNGAERLLRILDEHLWFRERDGADWLCGSDHPTIADIACFPYVALSEEGGIPQLPYPAIQRWMERFQRIEKFEPMAGMMPLAMPASDRIAGNTGG
ncbi:glutathione S-transferase N-terminal domain-containing protein [Hoeflea sp. TYP-13]|uniref:glutathione S-transferase N-terminal domain-containing protein n=1 Tax=Hoeflea sp. TYP-13 TaxID=3230023 RepID=UPI0034C5D823